MQVMSKLTFNTLYLGIVYYIFHVHIHLSNSTQLCIYNTHFTEMFHLVYLTKDEFVIIATG